MINHHIDLIFLCLLLCIVFDFVLVVVAKNFHFLASLGTTKYCSTYLKNQQCHKQDCMYLHELADEESSFTKEDMQVGF